MANGSSAVKETPLATSPTANPTNAPIKGAPIHTECHLLRLPPELRNHIFGLALIGEDTISASTRWPGITGTCKQIRAETLRMYLEQPFFAHIKDLNSKPLISWLSAIEYLDASMTSCITSVTFICEGQLLNILRPKIFRFAATIPTYRPNYKFWDTIIEKLQLTGFTAAQLIWPGLDPVTLASLSDKSERYKSIVQLQCLNSYILQPLLARHGLLDPSRLPVNVEKQLRYEWERLGLQANAEHKAARLTLSYGCGDAPLWLADLPVHILEENRAMRNSGKSRGWSRDGHSEMTN